MSRTVKRHRLIFNDDGGTLFRPFEPHTTDPFSLAGFLGKAVDHLVDTHVDVLSWTLGTDIGRMPAQRGAGRASNLYCHDTRVGERFWEIDEPFQSRCWQAMARNVRSLIEAGHDPPKELADYAHARGISVFCAFRMNDCHEGTALDRDIRGLWGTPELRTPAFLDGRFVEENLFVHVCGQKREHPELLIGEHPDLPRKCHVCFDYAHREVRDFRFALIEEAVRNYDIDGIELDFLRHNLYFKPGREQAGLALMSDLIARVRAMLDAVGRDRNRHLGLAVRVLAPLGANRSFGLDVTEWIEQGWVDILIAGIVNHNQLDLTDAVRVAHDHDCLVYASVKTDSKRDGRTDRETLRAIAANHYRAGADGMYMFNMNGLRDIVRTPHYGSDYDFAPLREIGGPDEIRFKDKLYVYDHKSTGMKAVDEMAYDELAPSEQERLLRGEIGSAMVTYYLPAWLEEDREAVVRFDIADDHGEAEREDLLLDVAMVLTLTDMSGGEHSVEMSLNGHPLPAQRLSRESVPVTRSPYTVEIPVGPPQLLAGRNVLALRLRRLDPQIVSRLHLSDMILRATYREDRAIAQ